MRETLLPLDDHLFEHPYEYDFFQAVRLLHLILNDRPSVGRIARPDEEPVRFQARQSLEFPPSSIHSLSTEADPPRMTVTFMGLTGVQGALPHHYTEHILARAQAKDFAMAEFFDLFNHRLVSLFYRAWEKHRFPVRFQLAAAKQQSDDFSEYLFDWIGIGMASLRGRTSLWDQALLRYAGLLGQRPASAVSLAGILRDYFGVPVEIVEFVGAWYPLSEEDRCDLATTDLNNQLGEGAIAGDAVWDTQGRFRVRLGPLKLAEFLTFLPDAPAVQELRDLVQFYVGPVLEFDLQLVLRADEVPWCGLGDVSPAEPQLIEGQARQAQLGWCGWLKTGEFHEDARDPIFAMS